MILEEGRRNGRGPWKQDMHFYSRRGQSPLESHYRSDPQGRLRDLERETNSNHRTHGCGIVSGKTASLHQSGRHSSFKHGAVSHLRRGHYSEAHYTSNDFDTVVSHSAGNASDGDAYSQRYERNRIIGLRKELMEIFSSWSRNGTVV